MANEQSHAALTAWAISSGLTASNVLNNGRSDTSVHVSADIAFAIGEAKLNDSHLVSMHCREIIQTPCPLIRRLGMIKLSLNL